MPLNKKDPVFTRSIAARVTFGDVSKAHLWDILADRARVELGEDVSEYAVLKRINEWSVPVSVVREDKPVDAVRSLGAAARRCRRHGQDRFADEYDKETNRYMEAR